MMYCISFPYIPKINSELFQKYSSHTLLFSGGRFRLNNLFFQEAQNYANENSVVEIFMEVSVLKRENVEDLFSKVGKWLFIELKG